jgi:transcriptional regulator with XRE-family HTH domain
MLWRLLRPSLFLCLAAACAARKPQLFPLSESPVSGHHESIDAVLAKNLVVARVVLGVTQQELSERADISRATIAQIETGYSDPRISTITQLAAALGIPAVVLLTGSDDVRAFVELLGDAGSDEQPSVTIPTADLERMRRYLRTGMLKDRVRAARIGAAVARASGGGAASEVCSAIFSALLPGSGTVAGARLGRILGECEPCADKSAPPGVIKGAAAIPCPQR